MQTEMVSVITIQSARAEAADEEEAAEVGAADKRGNHYAERTRGNQGY